MNVVVRVDASKWIGSGHVMRCLVLAKELRRRNHNVTFACLLQDGDLVDFLRINHFPVIALKSPLAPLTPSSDKDYQAWLQRSEEDDAKDFCRYVNSTDLIIVDHYGIGKRWHRVVRDNLSCKILAIDDLLRSHEADLILDQTLGRLPNAYLSNGQCITGTSFALLDCRFLEAREKAFSKCNLDGKTKILVSFGGIDLPDATSKVIAAFSKESNVLLTVLLSERSPHYMKVKKQCSRYSHITHLDFAENMAETMLQHDIAIGAAGTTSWERACVGLPNVVVPLAENQNQICSELVSVGASRKLELSELESKVVEEVDSIIQDYANITETNMKLVDGRGAKRVAQYIEMMCFPTNSKEYMLKKATYLDISTVYDWQCHSDTRRFALNNSTPSWDSHLEWMKTKLDSPKDFFYMIFCVERNETVGVVRLDRTSIGKYLVSIYVAPDHYGQGIGTVALRLLDSIHNDVTLIAKVLKENERSQRLFDKSRFERLNEENFIRKPF